MHPVIQLTIEDYDEIIALWEITDLPYKPKGRDSRSFLAFRLKSTPTWVLGIRGNDNDLFATVIASHDGQRGWINRLAIHPKYRNKGFGKMLIQGAENLLKKKGISLWAALIETDNYPSLNLFQNQGYHYHKKLVYLSKRESKDY